MWEPEGENIEKKDDGKKKKKKEAAFGRLIWLKGSNNKRES